MLVLILLCCLDASNQVSDCLLKIFQKAAILDNRTILAVLSHHFSHTRSRFPLFSVSNVLGVTIEVKNDYCNSIDIAGSTIVIQLLLWTTIAILLCYYCLKHYRIWKEFSTCMGTNFCRETRKQFQNIVKVHLLC